MHKKFPAGELNIIVRDHLSVEKQDFVYSCIFRSHDDLFACALACDAARRLGTYDKIIVIMPYVPYARQDRVCNEGEPLSIKVMADFINHVIKPDIIRIVDPHSDVTPALLNNCEVIPQYEVIGNHIRNKIIVCPDAGAEKKILKYQHPYITCRKVRDTKTGDILSTYVPEFDLNKDYIIVDDICDGGRTFIEIAKKMRSMGLVGNIDLFVTHGIFTNGLVELKKHFRHIDCYNKMFDK